MTKATGDTEGTPQKILRRAMTWVMGRGKKANAIQSDLIHSGYATYYYAPGKPVWTPRNYEKFSREAYASNVVANRCVKMVAQATSCTVWRLFHVEEMGTRRQIPSHPILSLLRHPNPLCTGTQLLEQLVTYRMISGNAYLLAVSPEQGAPHELHLLRPDRVEVVAGQDGLPAGYHYTVNKVMRKYGVDRLTGHSDILHFKQFHPLDDWYGLSPVEAAAYSIDQHNQAAEWNQALLQNGARPSGALVVKSGEDGSTGMLTDEQFARIRSEVDTQFSGAAKAGRPLLLEGGLDWKELSLSPKDMDFIDMKHSAARDIALAFGVPPQLLGIPGDNTYNNMAEARLAFWEQTILPLLDEITAGLNQWLVSRYAGEGREFHLDYDKDAITALAPRREALWQRMQQSNFLSNEEKRAAVGIGQDS